GDALPTEEEATHDGVGHAVAPPAAAEIGAEPESTAPPAEGKPDHDPEIPSNAAGGQAATAVAERAAPYEITGFAPGVEEEILRFEQRAWPERRQNGVLPRWNWLHIESARRLAIDPRVWLYREGDAVAAHAGAVPVKLKIGGDEQLAAWVRAAELPEPSRHETAGSRLMVRAGEELPFSLSLVESERMRAILLQLGWVQVWQLETSELMIHPDAVLQGKHAGKATLAEWGWRATTAVRTLFQHRARLDVQQVARFGERHDELWRVTSNDVACGVVRDASYLNWRYVDQPAVEVLRLEIVDGNALRGVVVLTFREATAAYPYRHAVLSDLVAPLADADLLSQLFQVAGTAAAERDADALLCEHAGQPLTRALRQYGFLMRDPGRFLMVNPGQLTPEWRSVVLTGKDWLITPGDADL
ncbi:MAG: hypothetical protein ACM3U2_02190, partial [Deltaproteobacteria bacterium]